MDIGSYVKQHLFDEVYRYGIVVGVGTGITIGMIKVAWTPRSDHPVASTPYLEKTHIDKIEMVCRKWTPEI